MFSQNGSDTRTLKMEFFSFMWYNIPNQNYFYCKQHTLVIFKCLFYKYLYPGAVVWQMKLPDFSMISHDQLMIFP